GLVDRGMRVLLAWAFQERGMHRVEWHVSSANEPSIKVARRLGMTREGALRENYPHRGERTSTEIWSVLAPEWRAARARAAH
ncbi:GNAT family N-acetyltransferase, partial [Streptomyces sp. NPDC004561]